MMSRIAAAAQTLRHGQTLTRTLAAPFEHVAKRWRRGPARSYLSGASRKRGASGAESATIEDVKDTALFIVKFGAAAYVIQIYGFNSTMVSSER
jgi:hypothetical protein